MQFINFLFREMAFWCSPDLKRMKTDFTKFLADEVRAFEKTRREKYKIRTERARMLNPQYRAIKEEQKNREEKRRFREKLVELAWVKF